VLPCEIEGDREDQRRRPGVHRVEVEPFTIPDEVAHEPDEKPEQCHVRKVALGLTGRIGTCPQFDSGPTPIRVTWRVWNARAVKAQSDVFERVVCGVDGSATAADAAGVAGRVVAPDGRLVLVAVEDFALAVHAGFRMSYVAEQLANEARRAANEAQAVAGSFHSVEMRLREGDPLDCLQKEIGDSDGTLAVVGTRDHSRAAGIALGSVTTHLLHEAPCSVLVARTPHDLPAWPREIVVGVDGSPPSIAAFFTASVLAKRRRATLRPVIATREPFVLDSARATVPELEEHDERVLHLLHVLSEDADLLVVGSRGLRGVRALGSVSERIAHEARSSVLVVRGTDQ
jgi:nucleotide-binding universal stress UspA family protein